MTVQPVAASRGRAFDDDARQLVAVLIVAIVAVLLGLGLRSVSERSTSSVSVQDVSASVPSGWVFREGVGDTLFLVYDPRNPDVQYLVSRPRDVAADTTIRQVADRTVAARSAVLTAFEVLEREEAAAGAPGDERVRSTWARVRPGLPVTGMEGLDLVRAGASGPLVITLEGPSGDFDDALAGFERFAVSVEG